MQRYFLLLGLCLAQASRLFAAEAQPTDAAASVPQSPYRSAFDGYRRASDESLADWRVINDEVAAVRGDARIMRGPARQPARPATAPTATGAPDAARHRH